MEVNYNIILKSFEVEAVNFVKKMSYDEKKIELNPNYKALVTKQDSSIKEGLLIIDIKNDYFNLKLIVKGIFEDEENGNIDNEILSELILPLLLPFSRSVVFNYLRDAGFYNQMLPTIDIQRSINSEKIGYKKEND
ncbi:hypothetical protein [Mammaliicoccus lentus]|uniref:hypothetical protein n=1 Tax=Mammaliicoccus lentus TaxID=42858 RepID=UPI0007D92429|nr:hypothetical protein [Mammaliicoccus lentus]OAO25175.1 hypothetical protein AXY34_01815 [Mammaliicoccus lentus]